MPDLNDEELVAALRDAGHEESAVALERKLTARAAVAARRVPEDAPINGETTRARLRQGYAETGDGAAVRRRRRNMDDDGGGERDGGE